MSRDTNQDEGVSRRSVLRGASGVAAVSMSGMSLAEARAQGAFNDVPTDPHTLDVFRSIVDAIVPRTPDLDPELGSDHGPGALAVELERFLVWDFNHFQEVRAETVANASRERFEAALPAGSLGGLADTPSLLSDVSNTSPFGLEAIEESPLPGDLLEVLDLGALERFDVTVASVPDEGPVDLDVVVEAGNDTVHRVMQNYPYAEALATAFEFIAAEFVLRGRNAKQPMAVNESFPAGGLFVRLHPRDRMRCLDSLIEGSVVASLDDAIGEFLPTLGILKFAVMGVFGLATLGYYSEWPAYGATKTATPNERELAADPGDTVGRRQTEYPGPAPGYAAHRGFEIQSYRENDWRDDS